MSTKQLVGIVGALLLAVFIGALFYNTNTNQSNQVHAPLKKLSHPSLSATQLAERLAKAIRFKTISESQEEIPRFKPIFLELHQYIEEIFPLVHSRLECKKMGVDNLSLFYIWRGKNYGTANDQAIILASHLDVVPVPEDTLQFWSHDPFAGTIEDGFIWGRGTMDDKQGVFAILEAVEWLLSSSFQPANTIYLVFGHDEEIGGYQGAKEISEWFLAQNIKAKALYDEGMTILKELVVPDNVALIGIAEKGSLNLEVSVTSKGGHSSTSTEPTAISILARALTKIEENPMKPRFDSTSVFKKTVEMLGAEASNWLHKVFLSNLWLFDIVFTKVVPLYNPLLAVNYQTTAAVTMIEGGIKINVLPTTAKAYINHRIVPGDTTASVLAHDIEVINDPRVQVTPVNEYIALEPSPVSSTTSSSYRALAKTTREVFESSIVVPALMIANTDTKYYWDIATDIYRFCPTINEVKDLARFHGINERISVTNYEKLIYFFYQLIQNSQ